jgi:hypothetical protein
MVFRKAGEKVERVLEFEAIGDRDSSLAEIMHLVDIPAGVVSDGWSGESARLFALDIAMTAIRRNLTALAESERQVLLQGLQQARTLVVGGRDDEIGFLQEAFEAQLRLASPDKRQVLLSALDALIPDPYRAALVSVRDTLEMRETDSDLAALLRDRLVARLGEGSLVSQSPHLYQSA